MQELIAKKKRNCLIFKVVLFVLAALFLACFSLIGIFKNSAKLIGAIIYSLPLVLFILTVIYICKCVQFNRSLKMIENNNLQFTIEDIKTDKYVLPKSKIYCGSRAFYSKKSGAIIPYSLVRWVYIREVKTYGITTQRTIEIFCDKKIHFSLPVNKDEISWMIENYILPQSPGLIVGYGKSQKEIYNNLIK